MCRANMHCARGGRSTTAATAAMLPAASLPRPTGAHVLLGQVLGRRAGGPPAPPPAPTGRAPPPPELALAGLPCLKRKPKGMPFGDWIIDTLVRCRGVMAALPRDVWPESAAMNLPPT